MILKSVSHSNKILFRQIYLNHYQTLNLTPTATNDQIKLSFLSLAKKYHPDNNHHETSDNKDFIKIKQAYDILKEPNSRKMYDMEMFPEKIQQEAQNFHYYRAAQFEQNHNNRKNYEKRKVNLLINSLIVVALVGFAFDYIDWEKIFGSSSMHELRRKNVILANQNIDDGPSVQERRRKYYAQQMKDKKIYGSVIQLKVRGAGKQSTRSRQKRLQGIASIQGIEKEKILNLEEMQKNQEYM